MQKKFITVCLAIAVAFIWGLLLFRVYNTLSASQNLAFMNYNAKKEAKTFHVPSYQVNSYYRDPFLSVLSDTVTEVVIEKPVLKPATSKPLSLPAFCGVIVVKDKKTAILKVAKKILFAKEGEHLPLMKVLRIQSDSVVVILDNSGERRVLHLEKIRKKET